MTHGEPPPGSGPNALPDRFMFGDDLERAEEIVVEPDHEAMGLHIARWWLKARRLREEMFGNELFADPAWDILLDLYTAEARGERVQVTSLAIAARVPHSTAIRWARIMTGHGWLVREKDPNDGRRIYIALSEATRAMMKDYLERLSRDAATPPPPLFDSA